VSRVKFLITLCRQYSKCVVSTESLHVTLAGDCVPQRAEHVSWRGHTAPLATELPAPDYGTVFHRTWKTLTYRTVNSGGC